ncbi:MAG TPA: flagellar hook-associated protein FlgK, partial [Gammaproteobacteria bacterium]|nr:flagellar hook-associated protein FlgK [Gammaproteobacteria bacterium]
MSATGDLLGIATGGLLAFKRALSTTGHNITNVNTDGYSRQRVELATQTPQLSGAGFIGSGVKVTGVTRAYDQFVTDQVRNSNASASGLNVYHQMASQLSNVLGDSSTGLSAGLNSFFNAVQGVANDPTSVPARQVLLGEGQSLVNRFHTLNKQLSDQRTSVNGQLKNAVNDINSLAGSIASLNQSIVNETGKSGGQLPNDLLDQRDQLLKELSSKVAVSTVTQDDGSVNVSIGKG